MNVDILNYSNGSLLKTKEFLPLNNLLEKNFDSILSQVLPQIKKDNFDKCASVKSVAEVSMSTKKMRPQKGSGASRQGSGIATSFRGGVKSHGPVGINKSTSVSWKSRRLALVGLISKSLASGRVVVVDDVASESYKTSDFLSKISTCVKLDLKNDPKHILVIHAGDEITKNVMLGTRNLFFVNNTLVSSLTTKKIISSHVLMFTEKSLEEFITSYLDISL